MKVRHRLLLGVVASAALASVLAGTLTHRHLREAIETGTRERMRIEGALLAAWLQSVGASTDFQALAVDAGRHLGARVTLVASDGVVLGDSSVEREHLARMENHGERPEIRAALERGRGQDERHSATTGVNFLYLATRVDGGGPVRVARIARPLSELRAAQSSFSHQVLLTLALAVLFLGALAYGIGRRLTRPLEELAQTAESLAGGAPTAPVTGGARDEVSRLETAFRRMRRATAERLGDLERERQLLLSVLRGMKEGLALVGADHRIRLANDSFRVIFGVDGDPAGRLFPDVVRHPDVLRSLEAVLREGHEGPATVLDEPLSGRSFEVRMTAVPSRGAGDAREAVVLFLDVSRLQALERVRREFVADVSHELRTPLTSIKGAVETILEEGFEDRQNALRFLEMVGRHAARMEALLDDLTDLSLIETGAARLDPVVLDAAEIAAEVVGQLHPKAQAAGVELRQELPRPFPLLADRRRLEQILVNLLDNGIKFNRRGGSVRVEGEVEGGWARLIVEDTGVGIPAGSLDRVFHRLYRGDRARSAEVPGTGLGLAIVKHLMGLHGGRVSVASEVGHGSRFVLEFPRRA